MKKLQSLRYYNILILLILLSISTKIEARSPAVLPVRGLEIPDANKKYPNGPPDISKTSFLFNKGIPKILKQNPISTNQGSQPPPQFVVNLIIFAGAFALMAPFIYILFFRKGQKEKIVPTEVDHHLKIATLPSKQQKTLPIEEENQVEKIKKAS